MHTTGIDLVRVADVSDSILRFGDRYLDRVYTRREQAECAAATEADRDRRLAARFAGKEAAFKALRLDAQPAAWRAIEIARTGGGWCEAVLHGAVGEAAARAGVVAVDVSITHESDYAAAVAIAARRPTPILHFAGDSSVA